MSEAFARAEICRVGKSLFERGYVHSTAGNISVRLDDGLLITPTDACLGFLSPDVLSKVSLNGDLQGGQTPSKTLELHMGVYRAAQAAGQSVACVIHTHSTHCVALSLGGNTFNGPTNWHEMLQPTVAYFVMKVGHVPLIPCERPGSPKASNAVQQAIADYQAVSLRLRAVMLNLLGPCVWHESPSKAMALLEELEETAKLSLLVPQSKPLPPEAIDELRSHFGASW